MGWLNVLNNLKNNLSDGYDKGDIVNSFKNNKKKKKKVDLKNSNVIAGRILDEKISNSPLGNVIKTGALKDGYQFGDATKTILGSTTDLKKNLYDGGLNTIEGAVDLATYGVSAGLDKLGAKKTAEKVKEFGKKNLVQDLNLSNRAIASEGGLGMLMTTKQAIEDISKGKLKSDPFGETAEKLDKFQKEYSISGNKTNEVTQGLGQLGMQAFLTSIGVPWQATSFSSSAGNEMTNAFSNNASYGQAFTSGIISGLVETGSEYVGGGANKILGMSSLGSKALEKLGSKISNKTMQRLAKIGIDSFGEGFEEVLSGIGTAIGQKLTYMKDKDIKDLYSKEDALNDFIGGAIVSTIGNVPSNVRSIKRGENAFTERTENEQKVFDSELQERIKEAEKDGKKLTKKEINQIEEEISEDLENGQIGIDRIQSSLVGDTYNQYKELQNKIKSLTDEQSNLKNKSIQEATLGDSERLKQIESEISELNNNDLKNKLNDELNKITEKDYLLQRSFEENNNKSKEFLYEGSDKDTDITKETIESTRGKLNNTKKAHNLVDALIKMGNDRGVAYKVTNNEELKQMGLIENGQTTNGVYAADNGEILVNLDSKNYLEQILVHETAHTLEGTDGYDALKQFAKQFAETNKSYEGIKEQIMKDYQNKTQGMSEEEANKYYDSEITAKILEDNLSNEDFIKDLTNLKPSVVQKIIDTIKYLKKQFIASSSEARKLNKLQYQMEQAYKKVYNGKSEVKSTGENKFSIQTDEKGNKYVNVETNQDIFKNKSLSEQIKIAKDIIKNNFVGKEFNIDNEKGTITNRTSNEYTHPSKKLDEQIYSDKLKASTEFDNIIEISNYIKSEADDGRHAFAKEGWKYYETKFKVGDNVYKGLLNVADDGNKNTIYDITKLENITKKQTGTRSTSANAFTTSSSLVENNIPQSNKNVKSDISTKYSIQEKENNTQELDNSSFSNTKYSVSSNTDNQGRKLSEKQQEYFKNSKVRDENGNLRVLYNGSGEHTIYNPAYMSDESKWGKGIYLTPYKDVAEQYGSNIKEAYVDIKNPLEPGKSITFEQYNNLYKSINDGEEAYREEYDMYDDDLDLLWDITNKGSWADYAEEIIKYTGKDGIIVDDPEFDKADIMIIAFKSNQVKNVDNINPTDDEDIRYSKNSEISSLKRKGTKGDEVKLEKELAPIKSRTKNLNTQKSNLKDINAPTKYSLSENEKSLLNDLKMYEEKGIASDEEIKKLKELENKSKIDIKKEKAKQDYIDTKVEKTLQKQSYKSMNMATKTAQQYLDFNNTQKKEFRNQISDLTSMTKEELINPETYNQIKDIINQYANKEYNFVDEQLKDVKSFIRNQKINVSDDLKKQITDYSYFRKASKLNISKSGLNVDVVWDELSELYPYYFDSNMTGEADKLQQLSDFMNQETKITDKYRIPDSELKIATDKVYNKLVKNALSNQDIESLQKEIEAKAENRTRQVIQNELLDEMGITIKDLDKGNDINSLDMFRTDPIRLNEKIFGKKTGQKINDATINKTKHNESDRIRWLNKERDEIKSLGIKARSKESEYVQKYGEGKYITDKGEYKNYDDRDLFRDVPNKEKREKIKKAAEVIKNKYSRYIDNINEVLIDMGYDPIPKRKDYFRHFYEINDKLSQWGVPFNANDMNSDVLPTDINGITDEFKPGKSWFASALQRTGEKTTYDAITGIDGYLENASNLIFHTEDIQRYRTLSKYIRENYGKEHGLENAQMDGLSDEQISQRFKDIQNNKLSKYVDWLDEQANALAGKKGKIDRGIEQALGRRVYTALNTLKSQVGSNMTGFNVRSAMTNFASVVQGASKTNKIAFLKGTLSTMQNIIQKDDLIDKSDFLTSRFGSDSLSTKAWQKISNAGQILMTGSDYFTSNQIWRSKYYENLSKGMTESEAIKNADDFSARIMGDRSKGATANLFNSKTLGFLTQFQLEVNNQWSSMIHDNKMDIKDGNKSGASVLFQLGQLYAMSYGFNTIMKSLTGSDVMFDPIDILKNIFKPDKDDDRTLEERTRDALGDVINQLPMASIFTGGRIPISEAFKGGSTAFKYMTGQSNEFGQKYTTDDIKKDFKESIAYWLLPTGYGQMRKTTKGLSMYSKKNPISGSYTDSGNLRFSADNTMQEKIKASLFGQYATKHAQDYIDSGFKSIDKKNLDEMKDLKMNSEEYKEYRKGLNDAGTKKEDKLNYINNLDIPIKKKNVMASNVMKKNMNMKEYNKYDSYEEFDFAYKNPEKYKAINMITSYSNYKKIMNDLNEIKSDVDKNGNSISGSRFKNVANYINSLNLSAVQKAMLLKQQYPSFKQYDNRIAQYINNQKFSFMDKAKIIKSLGFSSYDNQIITFIQNKYKNKDEQIKALEDLGYKIYSYNGKTYIKR